MADSTTIHEFLVSLGYKLDASEKQRFDDFLKGSKAGAADLDKSLAGVTSQLGMLGSQMTKVGEQRTRDRIEDLKQQQLRIQEARDLAERQRKEKEAHQLTRQRHDELIRGYKTLATVAVGASTVMAAGAVKLAEEYSNLYYISQRTGRSVADLKSLAVAGAQIGVDIVAAQSSLTQAMRQPGAAFTVEAFLGKGATQDITKFVEQWQKLPLIWGDLIGKMRQDDFAAMIGVSSIALQNLANNQRLVSEHADEYKKALDRAGISQDRLFGDGSRQIGTLGQLSRDLNTIWERLGITALKAFDEAQPAIDRAIKGFIDLINKTNDWNALHPGAALAETGAAAVAGTGVVGATLFGGLSAGAATAAGVTAPLVAGGAGVYMGMDQKRSDQLTLLRRLGIGLAGGPLGALGVGALGITNWLAGIKPPPLYQHGGIVPRTGPILAHQGEAFLPPELTQLLMRAASSGGDHGGDLTRFVHGFEAWWSGSTGYRPFVQILGFDPKAGQYNDLFGQAVGAPGMGELATRRSGVAGAGRMPGRVAPGGDIEGLKTTSGTDYAAIKSTIQQAGEKVGLNQGEIQKAQAEFLSAFDAETGGTLRHDIVRKGGTDTGWAQWVGSRRQQMSQYGDPKSIEANQKQLYAELTGAYKKDLIQAGRGADPATRHAAAHRFESNNAAQFEWFRPAHAAKAESYYRKIIGETDAPPQTRRSPFPPGTKRNSRGEPYASDLDHLDPAIAERVRQSMDAIKRSHGHWADRPDAPSYQLGGIVPRTGPIFAHAGETVLSRDMSEGFQRILGGLSSTILGGSSTINNAGDRNTSFSMVHNFNHYGSDRDAGRAVFRTVGSTLGDVFRQQAQPVLS